MTEAYIPVGMGAKFKVSERVNFDLGYTMNFVDGDFLDGAKGKGYSRDKWSYASAGVEFSLGSTAKPSLDWVNPVALMYDELKDPTLRNEVDALKGRVSALEAADLLKDSYGDGVAEKLDKCPNTEDGIKVGNLIIDNNINRRVIEEDLSKIYELSQSTLVKILIVI